MVREVLLEQVNATLLSPGVKQLDDAVAHPLDSRWLETGLVLDTRGVWTPEDTLEDAAIVSVRAQRRLLAGKQTSVSDEQLAHVVLGLDQREDFTQTDATRLLLMLACLSVDLDRCVLIVHRIL